LETMVLATLVIDKFSSLPGGMMSMRDFWSMSLRCALNAKELCNFQCPVESVEAIFVCGLLHDIGRLIFYRRIPALAREIGLQKAAGDKDEIQIEHNLLGFDHFQTGAELAKLWNLPAIIETTIRHHCKPELSGQFQTETNIIKLAYRLSQTKIFDPDNFIIDSEFSDFSISELEVVTEKASAKFDEIFSIFYPTH